ncbi:MAG: Gfo/Idh/MocA family oxidoreductase [Planctomycetes bacterium]|nr:Gfo/Idh/MocA family oxidoreductase [Planctomycetota bacterium]
MVNRREFLARSTAVGVLLATGAGGLVVRGDTGPATSANDVIRVACIGLRGRGRHHIDGLQSVRGASVTALGDVDRSILDCRAAELESRTGQKIKRYVDYRRLLDDPEIDAVSVATPNHTHALIAIAAMEAGKDVYVEKPCSHNVWEGRQLVRAARKYGRMCQHGTQSRSSPAVREAIEQLQGGLIGEVSMARAVAFRWRRWTARAMEEPVPPGVDYDLWLGPAPERPFSRHRFHESWRWHSDYGSGDLGNQGVHLMDLARWGLGVGLPARVCAAGGHFTFEYPERRKRLVFETRHWTPDSQGRPPGTFGVAGVTFHGSEGTMQVDHFGYRTFWGPNREPGPAASAGANEYERFVAGVRSRNRADLGAEIEQGHLSTALCHLGNISLRLRRSVHFDPHTETFPGDHAANAMLRGEYREPYVVRAIG